MRIIDLSQQFFDKMPVYPGDPEVSIKEIHTIEKEGWNLKSITITSHVGTHVNVPYHMVSNGAKLDSFTIDRFIGQTELYWKGMTMKRNKGVFFAFTNIDNAICEQIISQRPKFVGVSEKLEFDIAIQKKLFEAGIISYEYLTRMEYLPKAFMFYGVPLNIKDGDGSPVRAYAVAE